VQETAGKTRFRHSGSWSN